MMASSRGRDRSSPRDGSGFGRIGCLLHQAEEHAIMNRAETEDGSYASARNRKLLAGLGLKPGENEYAEPALNPSQTTAYAFFTGDQSRVRAPTLAGVATMRGAQGLRVKLIHGLAAPKTNRPRCRRRPHHTPVSSSAGRATLGGKLIPRMARPDRKRLVQSGCAVCANV